MPTIDANALQQLSDQISTLKTDIQTAGDEGRARLGGINVDAVVAQIPKDAAGKVNAGDWSAKEERERKKIQDGLVQVRDSLREAAGLDGPPNAKHIMSAEYASSPAIVVWACVGFLVTGGLLVGIVRFWGPATGTDLNFNPQIRAALTAFDKLQTAKEAENAQAKTANVQLISNETKAVETRPPAQDTLQKTTAQRAEAERVMNQTALEAIQAIRKGGATEESILLMVVLLGAFGGSLHLLRSLVKFVGNRELKRSWLLYYLSTPIVGAGLASIVYMVLRIGLLGPSGGSANGPANGSAIANLNLIAIYAFAVLSGLFAETAAEKLSEVFKTMFRTAESTSKDPVRPGQPSGAIPSVAAK